MMWLAYAPQDAWYLGYVALVPFMFAVVGAQRRQAFGIALLWGMGWWLLAMWWLVYPTWAGYIAACAVFLPIYSVLFGLGARWMHGRWRRSWPATVALLWAAIELARSRLSGLAFPGYLLGETQWQNVRLIQIADLAGTYGVSFLVAYVNMVVFAVLSAWTDRRGGRRRASLRWAWRHAVIAALALGGSVLYGAYRMRTVPLGEGLTFASVQGNVPQRVKEESGSTVEVIRTHIRLSAEALGEAGVEVVVWPETMVPVALSQSPFGWVRETIVRDVVGQAGVPFIIGSLFETPGRDLAAWEEADWEPKWKGQRTYNSAYVIDERGEITGRYDKVRPVLFSEYIPFRRTLPFLRWFVPGNFGGLTPASKQRLMEVKGRKVGIAICYEDMMGDLFARARRKGAEMMVVITNDGWFRESGELAYHFSTAVFRAVENRMGVIRSANTGVTGGIDPLGRAKTVPAHVPCVFVHRVETSEARTIYTGVGDTPLWIAGAGLVLALGGSVARHYLRGL